MATDAQVIRLRQLLGKGKPLSLAALKVGMDAETARKYRRGQRLPSESFTPRTWRTREDPFQEVWPELRDQLEKTLASKPTRSSLIFSVGSQAASPTASSARCSGRSKLGAPSRDHPRASDGPFEAVLGKLAVRNFRGGRGNPKLDLARRAPLPYSALVN